MPFLDAIELVKRDLRMERENTERIVARRQRTRTRNTDPNSPVRKALKSIGIRVEDLRGR
jgi:hypothetical protein